jgi:hypothetical protein
MSLFLARMVIATAFAAPPSIGSTTCVIQSDNALRAACDIVASTPGPIGTSVWVEFSTSSLTSSPPPPPR